MYQAIETKYFGPTNSNPGRVIAKAQAGKLVHEWDHSLGIGKNHAEAARKLAEKLGWSGLWFGAFNAKGDDNVFVYHDQNSEAEFVL